MRGRPWSHPPSRGPDADRSRRQRLDQPPGYFTSLVVRIAPRRGIIIPRNGRCKTDGPHTNHAPLSVPPEQPAAPTGAAAEPMQSVPIEERADAAEHAETVAGDGTGVGTEVQGADDAPDE